VFSHLNHYDLVARLAKFPCPDAQTEHRRDAQNGDHRKVQTESIVAERLEVHFGVALGKVGRS
jgi:hypothetical protein